MRFCNTRISSKDYAISYHTTIHINDLKNSHSELGLPVSAIHAQIKKMYKTKYCQQTTFMKIPGNGPSPGGRNNVPRILPSLTGTLFTPSAMYDF